MLVAFSLDYVVGSVNYFYILKITTLEKLSFSYPVVKLLIVNLGFILIQHLNFSTSIKEKWFCQSAAVHITHIGTGHDIEELLHNRFYSSASLSFFTL